MASPSSYLTDRFESQRNKAPVPIYESISLVSWKGSLGPRCFWRLAKVLHSEQKKRGCSDFSYPTCRIRLSLICFPNPAHNLVDDCFYDEHQQHKYRKVCWTEVGPTIHPNRRHPPAAMYAISLSLSPKEKKKKEKEKRAWAVPVRALGI